MEATGGNIPRLLVNGRIPAGGLAVNIEFAGGTASTGTDFNHTLVYTIPAGDYDGTTSIDISSVFSIIDDAAVEGDETIQLRLQNPQAPLLINDANCSNSVNDQTTYTILDDDFVLAVELASFTVSSECERNQLYWVSASEIDHAYYLVEQSKDGISWQSIGRVNAQESSNENKAYQFEHRYPATETYYRLRMVDIYGVSEFSDVIYASLPCNNAAAAVAVLYPNPVTKNGLLKLNIPNNSQLSSLRIVDMQGRVLKQQLNTELEISVLEIDIQDLPAAMYQLVYQIDGQIKSLPFVVQ